MRVDGDTTDREIDTSRNNHINGQPSHLRRFDVFASHPSTKTRVSTGANTPSP
jgi:hypothetical protein